MRQSTTSPEMTASIPAKSPYVTGNQSDVLQPTVDLFRVTARRRGQAIMLKDIASSCRYRFEASKPNAALVAYATSPGIKESGGDGLGIQFAETVTIRCD